MPRIPNLVKAVVVLVTLVAIGALLVLVFGSQAGPPATPVAQATHTPPPYPPPASPTPPGPPATPTASGPTPIPRCAFTAAPAPVGPGASLDRFVFSEPRIVLTHTAAIGIAGWLPDSERLLIVRDIPGTNRQAIETFNVRTGAIHLYADSGLGGGFWLPQHQAVAYFDYVWIDQSKGKVRHDLWISQGDPQQAQRIVEGISWNSNSAAVDPSGYLYLFPETAGERPRVLDAATRFFQVTSIPLDPTQWQYSKYPEMAQVRLHPFLIARRPNGSQLVFYTQLWTFLFDARTNQVCELDLDQFTRARHTWALRAQWSPGGRYLALETTDSSPGDLIHSTELAILDTETNSLRILRPAPDKHGITDMAWAPDGRYLAVLGVVYMDDDRMGERKEEGGFIVDAATGAVQPGPSGYDIGGGSSGWQLAWSPDGSQLAVGCPTAEEGRLCIIALKPSVTVPGCPAVRTLFAFTEVNPCPASPTWSRQL